MVNFTVRIFDSCASIKSYAVPFNHGDWNAGCHLGGGEPAEAAWSQTAA